MGFRKKRAFYIV